MSDSARVASSIGETLRSSRTPLDAATRSTLEPQFGYDFSQVRVHTDAKAAGSARNINARAYTAGREVVLGAGQYSPGTSAGRTWLAHELAHAIQQGGTVFNSSRPLKIDAPDSVLEREAEQTGIRVGRHSIAQAVPREGRPLIAHGLTPAVQRTGANGSRYTEADRQKLLAALDGRHRDIATNAPAFAARSEKREQSS